MLSKWFPPEGVGERLTKAMRDKGYDDRQMGRRVGIERKTICKYRNDESTMNISVCVEICKVLGVTPNWLLLGKED